MGKPSEANGMDNAIWVNFRNLTERKSIGEMADHKIILYVTGCTTWDAVEG